MEIELEVVQGNFLSVRAEGHTAGPADDRKIVCAAVSAFLETLLLIPGVNGVSENGHAALCGMLTTETLYSFRFVERGLRLLLNEYPGHFDLKGTFFSDTAIGSDT